ncbi:MAG: hypothetical protein JXA16_09925, partial [Bacteroidales bacterium]|nr:hypothetical protein [Bacteroidales bacterium]
DFIKSIYIKNFNIKKSNFNFKIYQNDSVYNNYSGKVIFDLRSFNLNKYQNQNQNKLFYADGFKLQLFDYSQDLKDRTHSINLDNITISSFDSLLYISKLSVQPRNDLKTYSDLEKKHINKIYSFSIQNSKIEGVDINKAYFDSILDIKSISINNPKFIFSNYTDIYELADTNSIIEEKTNNLDSDFADLDLIEKILEPDSTKHNKSLKDLLSSYYSIINIRNLNLQKGDFKYLEIDSNINIDVMMSGKLSVRLNEFRFDTKKSELKNKFSYSDNIQFAIDDFQMKFFDKNYQLKVKRAIFSSKDSIFNATIVRVFPTNKLLNSNNKKNTYTIYTPNIITKGTNSGEFIDNNILDFGNVLIKSPVIALSQKEIDEKTFSETDKNKKHRFPFQKIWFNKIEIDSGIFGLMNTNKFDINNLSIKTKFSANLFEIEIDSNKINNPKNIFKNLNAIATIYDLHYQMPDSIHFTDIKKIEINILQSKIYGDSLHYYNINANQIFRDFNKNEIDNLVIPKFYLNGFKFDNFFINKDLNLDTLLIIKPEIEIADFKTNGNNEKKLSQLNLYKKIYPKLKSINISEIEIDSAKLKLTANNKKRPFGNSFNNLFGNISNLIIDSVNQTRKNKILNSDDIKLKMKDYELNLSDSLYNFRFKEIGISTALHRLYIDLITINPNIERDKFADKNKKEFTLNYFFGKKIIAQNVDFVNLIDNKKIIIENINLLDFNLHTYKNKKFPLDSIKKIALPLDYIKKYDNYVLIDTISIKNSYIGYEILGKDANETGVIDLIDLEGRITNITNDKEKIKNQESTKLNLSAYLMNEGLLSASFDFPLNSKYGEYNFAGTLDSMSALPFNPLLENLLFVSLKEGYIDSAEFYVNVNEDYAEGNMKLAYSDLKVNLISKKKTDSLLVEKRGFATMVANSIIKGSNPKTKNSRLKENRIYYERNIYKPVFHYWTQSLLTGIKATLGFKSKEFKDRLKFEKISSRFNEKLRLKNKRKYNKTDKKKSKNTLKEAKHQKRIRKKEEKKKKKKTLG